jgi:hypothetical protein
VATAVAAPQFPPDRRFSVHNLMQQLVSAARKSRVFLPPVELPRQSRQHRIR